jgi:hypothetical protein
MSNPLDLQPFPLVASGPTVKVETVADERVFDVIHEVLEQNGEILAQSREVLKQHQALLERNAQMIQALTNPIRFISR